MNAFQLAEHLAARLEEDGLPYAIGGAISLTVWSIPRDTKDVDISIFAPDTELERVFDALDRAGIMVNRTDATKAVARIGMFNGRSGHTNVDVFISDHPHFHEMQRRRIQRRFPSGAMLWVISPEDLCVMKLLYARNKDVPDLERMFAKLPDLDIAYIRTWLLKLPAGNRHIALLDDLVRRFHS
jgi:Nucleotidyl transferase AbiEii toxin, Type IV TA system